MKRKTLIALYLTLCTSSLIAESAWETHGKLEVSKDGHRIQHDDGTPFLWIGDTAWGMFQQLTREEAIGHLRDAPVGSPKSMATRHGHL